MLDYYGLLDHPAGKLVQFGLSRRSAAAVPRSRPAECTAGLAVVTRCWSSPSEQFAPEILVQTGISIPVEAQRKQ